MESTSWVVGDVWKPADDLELGLDPTGDRREEKSDKEVTETPRAPLQPRKKGKSRASVCACVVYTAYILIKSLQKRPHIVGKEKRRETERDLP